MTPATGNSARNARSWVLSAFGVLSVSGSLAALVAAFVFAARPVYAEAETVAHPGAVDLPPLSAGSGADESQRGGEASRRSEVPIRHELKVVLDPVRQTLAVEDSITLPQSLVDSRGGPIRFLLHGGLDPIVKSGGVTIVREARTPVASDFGISGEPLELPSSLKIDLYRVALPPGVRSFALSYSGAINHPLEEQKEDYARGFSETPGTISSDGVFLSGASYWYPWFGEGPVTFALRVEAPQGWDCVSQGRRVEREPGEGRDLGGKGGGPGENGRDPGGKGLTLSVWESPEPQDEIYLVSGRFTQTERQSAGVTAMTFLREPDPNLAGKYLDATGRYLEMYSKLLGPYPYAKFALVENFWETGYGMPSFTLLGPKVIRLPFIINSSYPHEILHNWWGNSVYVDYRKGNWCEGLTAYLSDHLTAEQQGTGAEYRQTTLQKYADYVSRSKDFPLSEFRERHSPSTEAVGYGKSLMVFNMLRLELGDETFVKGLRNFSESNRFRRASFGDLRRSFESVSGKDLSGFFEQWVERPGAPQLRAADAKAAQDGEGWKLTFRLEQTQVEPGLAADRQGARDSEDGADRASAAAPGAAHERLGSQEGAQRLAQPGATTGAQAGAQAAAQLGAKTGAQEGVQAAAQLGATTGAHPGGRSIATAGEAPPPPLYRLSVPVAVTLEGRKEAWQTTVSMDGRIREISLPLSARPRRVDIDPAFDLFRRLDRSEIPPALSQAFGAENALVLLPSAAPPELLAAYRTMVEEWGRSAPGGLEVRLDNDFDRSAQMARPPAKSPTTTTLSSSSTVGLPAGRSVWIIGWENRFVPELAAALHGYDAALTAVEMRIGANALARKGHAAVLTARHPAGPDQVLAWVAADSAAAVPGLGRKLPHYHKYSYLSFEGDEPANVLKGRWPVVDSPMTLVIRAATPADMDSTSGAGLSAGASPGAPTTMGSLAQRGPLATLPPAFSKDRMMETVQYLAADGMGGRGFGSPELDKAAEFIAAKFREAGLSPAGDAPMRAAGAPGTAGGPGAGQLGVAAQGYFQSFKATGGDPARESVLRNVVGIIPGRKAEWAGQSVVVSAHYDHLGLGWPEARAGNAGKVHPGADDNASGVAVLLELARELGSGWQPDRTVVFVALAGEEAGRLGSKQYVESGGRFPASKCIGEINLDTVGRLGKGKLLVLGTGSAREWVHIFNGAGYVTGVPIETAANDFGGSDQKSFLDAGVPAVQLFSGPNPDYHSPSDTADKIDAEGLVRVASVAREAIDYLAGRTEPLTSNPAYGGRAGGGPVNDAGLKAGSGPDMGRAGRAEPAPQSPQGSPDERSRAAGAEGTPGGAPAGPAGGGPGGQTGAGGRRVSVGTVPDFGFAGPGLRLSGVVPGSPADKAGLREGDILTRIGTAPVPDLKAFSDILKGLKPGDRITIDFTREGNPQSVELVVAPR